MVHRKSWGRIVTIVILGLAVLCAPASSQQFSTPKNVSNNSDFSFTPQLAVDPSGNIYVVWEDDTDTNSNIVFSRLTHGEATFSAPKGVSNSAGYSSNPRIAVDAGGAIIVVWQDTSDFLTSNVFFSRSSDGGNTFSAPINLSQTIVSAFYSVPQIAVDTAGNISVVWESDAIWFSGLSNGGATFSAPKMLSTSTDGSLDPQIAVDKNGNINVVWEDDITGHSDIFFARSSDGGATFSTAQNVSHGFGFSSNPWLTVDAGANIYVSWEDKLTPVNRDIFFARSTDSGTSFPAIVNLSNDSGQSMAAQMAVDKDGNLNVVWQDNTPGISQIFFSRLPADAGAPTIVTPPANQTVTAGLTATFSVTASGTAPLSYQWQKDTVDISGATLASYTTPATTTLDNGAQFRVVVSNSLGTATSSVATLTVNAPPSITSQPANQTVTVGQMAMFSVAASGTAPLSCQWQKDGVDISGATLASYTTPATTTLDNGAQFRVVVSNSLGIATSSVATLTVNAPQCSPTLRVSLSPNALWSPNHKLVQITATLEASDNCDANPAVTLESITSNELDNGAGDGDQPNDIQAVGGGPIPFGTYVRSFLLRAERSGMGAGRVYNVNYMVRDAAGNQSLASAQVSVGSQTTEASPNRSGRKK